MQSDMYSHMHSNMQSDMHTRIDTCTQFIILYPPSHSSHLPTTFYLIYYILLCFLLYFSFQLLYVYINDYQSGGEMWYAVFSRSLIALLFAAFTLLGYLSLELNQTYLAGPFYFLLPLPFSIVYFWHYCEAKFKLPSMVRN